MNPFFPIPEVRKHTVQAEVDEFGDTWVDGVKVAFRNPSAVLKEHDATRVRIRADLDKTGIRDRTKTYFNEAGESYELLPPGDAGANVLQFNMDPTLENLVKVAEEEAYIFNAATSKPKPSHWQRLKRAARRLLRRRKAR